MTLSASSGAHSLTRESPPNLAKWEVPGLEGDFILCLGTSFIPAYNRKQHPIGDVFNFYQEVIIVACWPMLFLGLNISRPLTAAHRSGHGRILYSIRKLSSFSIIIFVAWVIFPSKSISSSTRPSNRKPQTIFSIFCLAKYFLVFGVKIALRFPSFMAAAEMKRPSPFRGHKFQVRSGHLWLFRSFAKLLLDLEIT